jgi:uncharacterized protein (TIGR02996 family)
MTDRDSLLAAIVAAPDDPVPRLVFADYLDEHGDPDWAELIRLQNGYFKHWTNAEEMADREAELVKAVTARYSQIPGLWLGLPVRGFPERLVFIDDVPKPDPEQLSALTGFPLTWFDFGHALPEWVIESPWLGRAVVIELSDNPPSDVHRKEFFAALNPTRLRALFWRDADLGDEDAEFIAAAPQFAGLTELCLADNDIGPDGCADLIASPHLTRLEYLDLSGNPVGTAAARLERRFGPALRLA